MVSEFVHWFPAEQPVQHRPQRIYVGRGANSTARHLLRAGVIGSQHAHAGHGRIRVQVENLGDAEIEQFRLAVGGHQDIAGLQIAVYHQVAVQITDRRADLEEQSDFLPRVQPSGKYIDGLAVDVFHGQKRLAILDVPGIEHSRDIRVGERSENLPFLQKAFALGVACAWREQFHGQALGHFPVRALGQIYRAHAAASDHVQQLVWPAAPTLRLKLGKRPACGDTDIAQQKSACARIEGK